MSRVDHVLQIQASLTMEDTAYPIKNFWPGRGLLVAPFILAVAPMLSSLLLEVPGNLLIPAGLSPLLLVSFLACIQRVVVSESGVSIRSLVPFVQPADIAWHRISRVSVTGLSRRTIRIEVGKCDRLFTIREDMIRDFDGLHAALLRGVADSPLKKSQAGNKSQ